MINSEKRDYWRGRAEKYSSFNWANDENYLKIFVTACDLEQHFIVLDAGCGPGIVADYIRPHVERVIGMDSSKEILAQCNRKFDFMLGDIAENPFPSDVFDRVIVRNVLHDMPDNFKKGLSECHRVLKRRGKIIIGDRMPPSDIIEIVNEYRDMLALKDRRIVFTEVELREALIEAGFNVCYSTPVWIRGFSVRAWLDSLDLDPFIKAKIWDRHENGSPGFKEASRMRITEDGGCLIDLKNIIIVGEKP